MSAPTAIAQRQLDLGPAGWFRAEALDTPANQVRVKAGFMFQGAFAVRSPNPDVGGFPQDQLTTGFALVGGGNQRWDLVYLDANGIVQVAAGTQVALSSAFPYGAPGWTGTSPGPALPDAAIPVAYVLITETGGTPAITPSRIKNINGFLRASRELTGFHVDKGLLGAAPTGSNDIVTTLFAGESPLGSSSVRGIVTVPPENLVHLLDQKRDELVHAATGSRVYGRITFAASVWTLTYYYTSALGVETVIGDIATDCTTTPTDLRLVGTPKVFSLNDPARPLFASGAVILDQVVGDIPDATTTVKGKVLLAANLGTGAGTVVQGNDTRLQGITGEANTGGPVGPRRSDINIIQGTNVTVSVVDNPGNGSIDITINSTAAGGFPGYGGTPPADAPGGSSGGNSTVSRSDHVHPLSSHYALSFQGVQNTGSSFSTSVSNPRFATGIWHQNGGTIAGEGVAYGSVNQASAQGGGAYATGVFGQFISGGTQSLTFSNLNSLSGTTTFDVTYIVLGQTSL